MASTKISELSAATTLTGTETIPVVQGGVTKKVTTDQFLIKDASGNVALGTTGTTQKLRLNTAVTSGDIQLKRGGFIGFSNAADNGNSEYIYANGGALDFGVNGSTKATLDASGNLGLGVTPSAWGMTGTLQLPDGSIFGFAGPSGDIVANAYYNAGYKFVKTGAASKYVQTAGSHTWSTAPSGTAGNPISFTQAMTLDASGNLGVGVTPSAFFRLDINGNARISSAGAEGFEVQPGAITYVTAYNRSTAAYTPMVVIGEYISFSTGLGAERARIDASGNLLVGTTVAVGSGVRSAFHSAHASGAVAELYASNASYGGNALLIYANRATTDGSFNVINYYNAGNATTRFVVRDSGNVQNTNNSYGAYSDLKLKENITDASPKLAKLMQVRIVNYNLKADPDKTKLIGVVAQELEQISPGLIEETADRDAEGNDLGTTTKSVKYSVFVPMLIKSLQEQQAQIEALEARLAAADI